MRGYVVVEITITQLGEFEDYAARIPALIEKHGGRYIVKAAVPKVIRAGAETPQYFVILEFPSVTAADEFIAERSCSDLLDIFNRSTVGRIVRVEGCT